MIKLIVDSGSTKTDWIALDEKGKVLFETQTLGLNPQVLSDHIIEERVINNFELYQNRHDVSQLYFYGAGCGIESPRKLIKSVFEKIFDHAEIQIKEDTYAAVYAVSSPGEPSIVCILGTGSNCSYFDGKDVFQKVTSLGYILMDDASGNYFGRQLIRDYYFERMPASLSKTFAKEHDLSAETIKDFLYRKPNPNTYLATFAKFLIEHKEEKYCQKLIRKGLKLFVKNQIFLFDDHKEIPIHFIGSIGFYLEKELTTVLDSFGLKKGIVIKKPIEGLVAYHQNLGR